MINIETTQAQAGNATVKFQHIVIAGDLCPCGKGPAVYAYTRLSAYPEHDWLCADCAAAELAKFEREHPDAVVSGAPFAEVGA